MNKLASFVLVLLFITPFVLGAVDFNQGITPEEEDQFDQILAPIIKIYKFIKYATSVAGVLMLVFSGITFVMSGGEQAKKDTAKKTAAGVVIGLILIWVAPLVVTFIFS